MLADFSSSIWFLLLQWIYALWQAVRNTQAFHVVYYTVQYIILRVLKPEITKKRIVWVNPNRISADYRNQYYMKEVFTEKAQEQGKFTEEQGLCPDTEELREDLDSEEFSEDLEELCEDLREKLMSGQLQVHGFTFLDYKEDWYKVLYKNKYYWLHQDIFCELVCHNPPQCIFVKNLHDVGLHFSIAQRISEEEAMLMLFSRNMHLYDTSKYDPTYIKDDLISCYTGHSRERPLVIHGREFNIEFNSKLGGFLATIPLILQARGLNVISALASLVLLLVDFFRTPIYNAYDRGFFYISKFVKLHMFGKRTWFYSVFELFSDRWRCSDFLRGYAYLTQDGDEIKVSSYARFVHPDDCKLIKNVEFGCVTSDDPIYTIMDGVISSSSFISSHSIAFIKVKGGMYLC